jgi:hypothetical protein
MGTGFDWAIITQIDRTEAFELLDKLRRNIFWTIVIIVILVGAAGFFQSRIIARPINDLSYRIVLFNDGDLYRQSSGFDEAANMMKSACS